MSKVLTLRCNYPSYSSCKKNIKNDISTINNHTCIIIENSIGKNSLNIIAENLKVKHLKMVKESINGIKLVNAFYVVNNDILNHTVLKIKK